MYLRLRANHLPLVSNRTSKDKEKKHPRLNGTGAANAIQLRQENPRRKCSGE